MGRRKLKAASKRAGGWDGMESDSMRDEYRRSAGREEKTKRRVESHRRASAAYDARHTISGHPEVKERRRLFIAERRAAVKLKKRKWDPPKKAARIAASAPEDSDVGRSSTQDLEGERGGTCPRVGVHTGDEAAQAAVVLDLRAENLVMFDAEMGEPGGNFTKRATSGMVSLTPDEALALVALAGMARGAAAADAAPGLETSLGQARLLSSHRTSLRVLDDAADLPASQTVMSGDDRSRMKADGEPKITSSARVEQARATVAALNAGPFSKLFLIDVWLWDEVPPPARRWWARGAQMSREAWGRVATWRAAAYETDNSWDSATAEEWAEVFRSIPMLRMIEVVVARDNQWDNASVDTLSD
ncbi:hypothetical protein DFH09DRAFT_1083037 [Mycena vulgaris]|nr:hypothetical protein DFH09DRAFT_1083037 [Mycena vulgaris]